MKGPGTRQIATAIIVGFILLGVGVFVLFGGLSDLLHRSVVDGNLTSIRFFDDGYHKQYLIAYTFSVDGHLYSGHDSIRRSDYYAMRLRPNDPIAIRYEPANPYRSSYFNDRHQAYGAGLSLAGLFVLNLGLAPLLRKRAA